MAITINQSPTTPNASYTNLLYAVASNHVTASQFQYVMDIVSGSTILSRVKQFPNPAGAGIFDPSRIINDYLEYNTNNITGSLIASGLPQVQNFTVKFGEEYAASLSGSVVLYNGNDVTGSPAVNNGPITVFPATVDPNNGSSYNWPGSNSIQTLTDRPDGIGKQRGDDMSITIYNPTGSSGFNVTVIYENGPSVQHTINSQFEQVPILGSDDTDSSYFDFQNVLAGSTIRVPITDQCHWERVNFAFINNYGFWDFYGVNLPQKKNTSIKRKEITTPFVDYSSGTSQYNLSRRGKGYYQTSYEDSFEVVTDWLSQEQAEWLTQLLESPEVYVETDAGFAPIVLTNSSYRHNTNRAAQKNFQYTIQYKFSNQRRTR